ncbi:hypothetical protein F5Y16DRAFT_424473 [Xylariaceae sp. FL0255]|nr:hypothetical protein F5Y16DRAFT_424473 [Xylariaceae sp. FL0255]
MGTWSGGNEEVLVTKPDEMLASLDIINPKHPVLHPPSLPLASTCSKGEESKCQLTQVDDDIESQLTHVDDDSGGTLHGNADDNGSSDMNDNALYGSMEDRISALGDAENT